jgi:hypothetical protein
MNVDGPATVQQCGKAIYYFFFDSIIVSPCSAFIPIFILTYIPLTPLSFLFNDEKRARNSETEVKSPTHSPSKIIMLNQCPRGPCAF